VLLPPTLLKFQYIDFSMGQESGYIRYEDSKGVETARAMSEVSDEGGLLVKDHIARVQVVTGIHLYQFPCMLHYCYLLNHTKPCEFFYLLSSCFLFHLFPCMLHYCLFLSSLYR
jgi:RNA binding motif